MLRALSTSYTREEEEQRARRYAVEEEGLD